MGEKVVDSASVQPVNAFRLEQVTLVPFEEPTMKARSALFALIVGLGSLSSASAAFIETPLPTNTYITLNGFDWA